MQNASVSADPLEPVREAFHHPQVCHAKTFAKAKRVKDANPQYAQKSTSLSVVDKKRLATIAWHARSVMQLQVPGRVLNLSTEKENAAKSAPKTPTAW